MTVALRTCKKCGEQKPVDRFSMFTLKSGVTRPRGECWDCRGLHAQENFDELADYRRSYNANNRSVKRERDRNNRAISKAAIDKLKDVPCLDCGRRFPSVAMDFDHVGPKSRSVAGMVSGGYKLQLILEEIAKCEIVCACCHRVRTAKRKENVAPYVPSAPYRAGTLASVESVLTVFASEKGLVLSVSEIRTRLGDQHVSVKVLKRLASEGRLVHVRRGRHCYCLPETTLERFQPSEAAENTSLSVRSRILALFIANPTTEYSSGEIVRYLGTNEGTVRMTLSKLLKANEVVRSEQRLYQATTIPKDWNGRDPWRSHKLTFESASAILSAILSGESSASIVRRHGVSFATVRNVRDGSTKIGAQAHAALIKHDTLEHLTKQPCRNDDPIGAVVQAQ